MTTYFRKITFLLTICLSSLTLYFCLDFPLPSEKDPIRIYCNQKNDHLAHITKKALKKAKDFVLIHTYALSDEHLLKLLEKKRKQHCHLHIYTDAKTSKSEKTKHPDIFWHLKSGNSLMHEKILMIDHDITYLGTANLTYESLNRHDNLFIGIYSKELASYIYRHSLNRLEKISTNHKSFIINNQELGIWFLPDRNGEGLKALLDQINHAQSKIQIAIYTLTHPKLLEALIDAKNRDVDIELYIDQSAANGASKKACTHLISNNIFPKISSQQKLLHYKMMFIDNKNLIVGSSNFTKNAFTRNQDFFMIINNLNKKQINIFVKVFDKIKKESKH